MITFSALLWIGTVTSLAQIPDENLQNALRDQAAFTADDFSALERGEVVVRLLSVKDLREVAVCGVVRLPTVPEVGLKAFQQSMTQQNRGSILEVGKFSRPSDLVDLQTLTLENRDIADLKRCTVGDCKLKMSAAMIERFHKEVNWSTADHRLQATLLFRRMLLQYVRDYLERGDPALIEYQDQSPSVRLAEEQRSLLDGLLYLNASAPEFTDYLKAFPRLKLPDVENTISWAKISFGLKPVIIVTHVATLTSWSNATTRILVVSKQLYANHYFDSSLALTAVVSIPTARGTSQSYLLYTNHSRAAALAGAFSKLKHKVVEDEAVENLKNLLQQTRLNVEISSINQLGSPQLSLKQRLVAWLFGRPELIWWFVSIIVLVSLFWFGTRLSKRNVKSFGKDR